MIAKRFVWLVPVILVVGCSCKGDPGTQGVEGPPGPAGPPGAAGRNALVSTSPESPGANCPGGGTAIRSGVDANGNNALDASEVTSTAYACNGNSLAIPPGTVVAYAGSNTSAPPAGWLFCDGAEYPPTGIYQQLSQALGTIHGTGAGGNFRVPDYRGRFLRGADLGAGRDPDRTTRTAPATGGATGNNVGSVQAYATARPSSSSFTTDTQGNHTHGAGNFNQLLRLANGNPTTSPGTPDPTAGEPDVVNSAAEVSAGNHAHSITGGGDAETRPANVYVNYLIKL